MLQMYVVRTSSIWIPACHITLWPRDPRPATHLMQGSCHRVLTRTAFKPSHETLMRVLAHTAANKPNLVSTNY